MKMVIYGVNFAPELTGIGKYTGDMVEWLKKRGHDIRVIAAPPHYPNWQIWKGFSGTRYTREYWNGATVFRCPIWLPRRPTGTGRILLQLSFLLASLPVLLRQVFWRPDVIWISEPPLLCAPAALALARITGAVSVLHIQDYEVDAAFSLGILSSNVAQSIARYLESSLLSRFTLVSTIAEAMLAKAKEKGVSDERLLLFPNWADAHPPTRKKVQPRRGELGIPEDHSVALYSGSMGAKQGLEILAGVARRLTSEKIFFVFCGDGAAKQGLIDSCAGLSKVIFLPLQPKEAFEALLDTADIHLLPQRSDAADLVMPSKLIGMMASGRPVVATAAQGTELAALIEDRANCGSIVPPGDVDSFADAISSMSLDPMRREKLGANGKLYVNTFLDKDSILVKFEAELMHRSRRG